MSNSWSTKELESRKEKFLKDYDALTDKHGIGLVGFPQYLPTKDGFTTSIVLVPVDKKGEGVRSPLQTKDVIQ